MPAVSIGMPVFNDVRFLPLAIESLLSQSFENFELIISDDCSTDGSEQVCLKYANIDSRIRYVKQKKNLGISKNMMYLLEHAKGDYFMWAGNDDMWDSNFIKQLVDALRPQPDCIVAFCSYIDIDEHNKPLSKIRNIDYSNPNISARLHELIRKQNDAFGYGLFKKDKIKDVRFPVWAWINKNCAYDNIYPTLCFYLSRGNFCLVHSENPLWFNRIKHRKNINHRISFSNSFVLGYLSFIIRKLNLVIISALSIYRGCRSIKTVIQIFPRLFFSWFVIPSFYNMHKKYSAYNSEGPKIFI